MVMLLTLLVFAVVVSTANFALVYYAGGGPGNNTASDVYGVRRRRFGGSFCSCGYQSYCRLRWRFLQS